MQESFLEISRVLSPDLLGALSPHELRLLLTDASRLATLPAGALIDLLPHEVAVLLLGSVLLLEPEPAAGEVSVGDSRQAAAVGGSDSRISLLSAAAAAAGSGRGSMASGRGTGAGEGEGEGVAVKGVKGRAAVGGSEGRIPLQGVE